MEVHHHPVAIGSHTSRKKMDTLFPGVSYVEFEVDQSGKPVKAWFIGSGEKIEMKKQ